MQAYGLCDGGEEDDGKDRRRKVWEKELKNFWQKTEVPESGQGGY